MATNQQNVSFKSTNFWDGASTFQGKLDVVPNVKVVVMVWDCIMKGMPLPPIFVWERYDSSGSHKFIVGGANILAAFRGYTLDGKDVPWVTVSDEGKVTPCERWEDSLQYCWSKGASCMARDDFRGMQRAFTGYTGDTTLPVIMLEELEEQDVVKAVASFKKLMRGSL